jgi:hypothetical protein
LAEGFADGSEHEGGVVRESWHIVQHERSLEGGGERNLAADFYQAAGDQPAGVGFFQSAGLENSPFHGEFPGIHANFVSIRAGTLQARQAIDYWSGRPKHRRPSLWPRTIGCEKSAQNPYVGSAPHS